MLHSISQQIWKTQQWPQDWKRWVFIPNPKKTNAKECSDYCTIVLISHTSKVMLKILQARLEYPRWLTHKTEDLCWKFRWGYQLVGHQLYILSLKTGLLGTWSLVQNGVLKQQKIKLHVLRLSLQSSQLHFPHLLLVHVSLKMIPDLLWRELYQVRIPGKVIH